MNTVLKHPLHSTVQMQGLLTCYSTSARCLLLLLLLLL